MRGVALVVATAATALLAGCVPAPSPSQPTAISPAPSTTSPLPGTTPPSSTTPAPAEHGSLARCLHEHGVPDSAGTAVLGPPSGVDPGVWDQAMKACSPLEPGPAG
ncbi:hypothetical protein CRM90_17500 [Mycobacterium sp. ENV421]|uniref:hypothetical protein n=1 Tax=unclassified Mycobacterium TaxID=2642494 RepID=UPI000C9ADB7D|nr:hypothetical protein [Mycobacterium sp. ENV421]PND56402.1 hypothetical protein CRM90_17500 [Mycobacterium sp. ENV421]